MNDALYFFADDGTNGFERWRSDGTEAGTVRVKDINKLLPRLTRCEYSTRYWWKA